MCQKRGNLSWRDSCSIHGTFSTCMATNSRAFCKFHCLLHIIIESNSACGPNKLWSHNIIVSQAARCLHINAWAIINACSLFSCEYMCMHVPAVHVHAYVHAYVHASVLPLAAACMCMHASIMDMGCMCMHVHMYRGESMFAYTASIEVTCMHMHRDNYECKSISCMFVQYYTQLLH